ncbi:MAG: dTMP kinase [Candidatus Methanomethylophilaceae archaeon]|nr:dTMP kinase [Candidatus Methanomethylophilaceae archaeon]
MKGPLIVVEGIDGSGKSTLCKGIADRLRSRGVPVEVTAEPTHDRIGALIRSDVGFSPRTEALLFVADRNDHTEAMDSWRSEGKAVVCDRYFASTVAYQSSGERGCDAEWLLSINSAFTGEADVTILLDLDQATAMGRVDVRGEEKSKFEKEDFLKEVRRSYLELANRFGFHVVDASRPGGEVLEEVFGIIERYI